MKKKIIIVGQNINVMNNNQTKIKALNTILNTKDDVQIDDKANEYSNVMKLLDIKQNIELEIKTNRR